MKKSIILLFFGFVNLLSCQNMINKSINGYFDSEEETLMLDVNGISFKGKFEEIIYEYRDYLLVKGDGKHLFVRFSNLKSKYGCNIDEAYIISGDIDKIKKDILKNKLKKDDIIYHYYRFTSSSDDALDSEWENEEYLKEKQQKEKQKELLKESYFKAANLDKFKGVYKVKLTRSGSVNLINLGYTGELHVSKAGVTFKSDLPGVDLLRASHEIKEFTIPKEEGLFYCKLNRGIGDNLAVSISENFEAGSVSVVYGKNVTTTTFTILNKIN